MKAKVPWILFLFPVTLCLLLSVPASGLENSALGKRTVTVRFFWGEGCPHCAAAKPFLEKLKAKYPGLKVESYEVYKSEKNLEMFEKSAKALGKQAAGVPAFFIGNSMIVGFSGETEREIEEKIGSCLSRGNCDGEKGAGAGEKPGDTHLNVPFLGRISTSSLSLPVFTVVVAALDSFNPCAFFVLLFLLSLLLHTHSRKRMALVGGIFVLFSGLVYFLFMAAWLNIFLLAGNMPVITVAAGSVALLISLINIKDFFFFKKGVSLSIPEEAKPKLFDRMRKLLRTGSLPAMMAATVVLAVVANSYELLCTAGFPMIYTRALTLHSLSRALNYLYLAFYNAVYVLPLLVIVLVFVITLGGRKLSAWQGRKLKLVSGLMMFGLGLVLLLEPSLLNNALTSAALLALVLATSTLIFYLSKKIHPDIAAD